ncbi:MAG: BLUF domain-containing protein [Pseudomonadota bacterium]
MSTLFHWVYGSHAAESVTDSALDQLLETARKSNTENEITGVLLYADRAFFQIIEGPEAQVQTLSKKIIRDGRHQSIETVRFERKMSRDFPDWKMGYVRLDNSPLPDGYFPVLNRFFSTYSLTDSDTESFYFIEAFRRHFLR